MHSNCNVQFNKKYNKKAVTTNTMVVKNGNKKNISIIAKAQRQPFKGSTTVACLQHVIDKTDGILKIKSEP